MNDRFRSWVRALLTPLRTIREALMRHLTPGGRDRDHSGRHDLTRKIDELRESVICEFEAIYCKFAAITTAIERLEQRMTSVEQQTWDELGRLIGVVVAEVTSLRDGIAVKDAALQAALTALQDADSAAATQVQEALDADSAADTERTLSLIDQVKAALPAEVEVPEVPVPPIGEPAEPEVPTEPETPAEPAPVDPEPAPAEENPVAQG